MFEKWESKSYPGVDAAALHKHAFSWRHGAGFRIMETGPGQFRAVSASRWGLEREATVTVKDVSGVAILELRFRANVTTEGVLAGGIALILLWPVAVLGGAYSYAKYETDALDLMASFWNSVGAVAQVSPTDQKEEVIHTTAVPKDEMPGASDPATARTGAATATLTREEKLSLLEDRLARGEISEGTYNDIKARIDSGK